MGQLTLKKDIKHTIDKDIKRHKIDKIAYH